MPDTGSVIQQQLDDDGVMMILGEVNGVDAVIIAVLMKLYVFTTTTIMTIIIIIRINETGNYHTVLMVRTVIRITQTQSKCRQLRGLLANGRRAVRHSSGLGQ